MFSILSMKLTGVSFMFNPIQVLHVIFKATNFSRKKKFSTFIGISIIITLLRKKIKKNI